MASANNCGWDFVKVGSTYQYKEDGWIVMVKILEDNSTADKYRFIVRVEKSTDEPPQNGGWKEFEISHVKDGGNYWGMMQIYENEEYECNYQWVRVESDKIG